MCKKKEKQVLYEKLELYHWSISHLTHDKFGWVNEGLYNQTLALDSKQKYLILSTVVDCDFPNK